jgi:hypothetical protein
MPELPPLEDWPNKLPEPYRALINRYTPTGQLRREYRDND